MSNFKNDSDRGNLSPIVQKRVDALKELQNQQEKLKGALFEEIEVLKAKYEKLYQPLYTKRYEIVNAVSEVKGVKRKTATNAVKGVPNFWLTAMKNNMALKAEISEGDEKALKFLKDIKCSMIDKPKGFMLEFLFDTNPYFENSVLSKVYYVVHEENKIPVIENVIGTKIKWFPGKCLTEKIVKKMPRNGIMNMEQMSGKKHFFNFFNPSQNPLYNAMGAAGFQFQKDMDYAMGLIFRDDIIPKAVLWFTVEAADQNEEALVERLKNEFNEDMECLKYEYYENYEDYDFY